MEKEKQLRALRQARLDALEEARQVAITEREAWKKLDRFLAADAADNCVIGIRALIRETEALAAPQSEPHALSVTHVPADSLRPQSANLHSGDEVWVRGKFLRYRDDGKIAVQLYPNDQNFFTAEQVKQALLASGHSTGHAIVLKDELNGLLAAAAHKPADLSQEQTHFCQNTKQIELTSLSACSCVEPDAFKPATPASRDRDDSCPCCNRMKCICKAKPAPACEAPLSKELRSLVNECNGILSLAEAEIAQAAGVTNLRCFKRRIDDGAHALAASVPPTEKK